MTFENSDRSMYEKRLHSAHGQRQCFTMLVIMKFKVEGRGTFSMSISGTFWSPSSDGCNMKRPCRSTLAAGAAKLVIGCISSPAEGATC